MGQGDARSPYANEMRPFEAAFIARVTVRNRLPLDYSVAGLLYLTLHGRARRTADVTS
ncbi:hypothetical protein ACU639_33570 [Streptomyces cynarae]|uniref:hypothetical protein n=1 Tax=Streptomyces cynarae TaxID=2981134 RepID=UPI00406C7F6C